MATYQYGGKTFLLSDGLSNEEALSKIRTSLGDVSPTSASTPPMTREQVISQIPTERGANTAPSVQSERSFLDNYVRAPVEATAALVTGIPASFAGQSAGLVHGVFGGRYGTAEGARQAEKTASKVSQYFTYAPKTDAGQELVGNIGAALAPLAGLPPPLLGAAPLLNSPLTTIKAGTTLSQEAFAALQAKKARAVSDLDYQASPRIDAVKAARALPEPISVNPAQASPTMYNKAQVLLAGQDKVNQALLASNKNRWGNNAKVDMGIHRDVQLTPKVFEALLNKQGVPYQDVKRVGTLVPDEPVLNSIKNIEIPDLISDAAAHAASTALVDRTLSFIDKGMNGKQALGHIRQLRDEVNRTMSAQTKGAAISPSDQAQVSVKKQLASALEDLLENNIPVDNPTLLAKFRQARTDMKKTYDYQLAVEKDTWLLDPTKLPDNMTGIGGDMRAVAANFPDAAHVSPTAKNTALTRLTRGGVAGSLGAGVGLLTGVGMFPGVIAGAASGEVLGSMAAKRMATPAYQAKRAVPPDRRIPHVEPEAPSTPASVQERLGSGGHIPETPFRDVTPNWQYGQPQGQAPVAAARMFPELPAPSGEATRQMVLNEQNRQGAMSRVLGQQQEVAQAAQEASSGYGQRRTYQAPDAVPAGAALPVEAPVVTASQKVASGQLFNMSATEKVAWAKTKTDIQEISPALRALDSKAIDAKMADRKWVEATIVKAQEKIKAFAEIEAKAATMQTMREAQINREKLMDTVQQLQDTLQARSGGRK